MTKKEFAKQAGKKTTATLILPVAVYVVLLIVYAARTGGFLNIFTGAAMSSIIADTAYMAIIAMGIGFQLKFGRFDFSGGTIVVVGATIGAVLADATGLGIWFLMLTSVLTAVVLSVINASVYSWLKIPISVCSLAMAYFFESIPGIVLGGDAGPSIVYESKYNVLGMFPLILVPFALALVLYFCYDKYTVVGRQSVLLARNQGTAVHIGINEKKNTIITYVISGIMFGLAGAVYATQNTIAVITTPLETASTLFSNIIPALVGLFLVRYIDDTLGVVVGALTISLLYYGLEYMGVLGGLRTICYAVFLAVFIFVSGFWEQILLYGSRLFNIIVQKLTPKKLKS